jgi:PAS domain S-box-containing protein
MFAGMVKNLSIGARLGLGFGIVFLLFCALTFFSINRMQYLANETGLIHNHPLAVSNAVLRVNANIIRIHRSMKDVVLDNSSDDINRDSRLVDRLEKKIYADFDIIGQRFLGDKARYRAARQVFADWKPVRNEVIGLMLAGKRNEAADITRGKGALHVVQMEDAMEALNTFAQAKADEFVANAAKTAAQSIRSIYLLLMLVVALVLLFTIYLTRSITRPLSALQLEALEIGKGRFDRVVDVKTGGEVGALATSIREMAANLSMVTASRDKLNREIVERRLTEEKLKHSEERILLLLESAAEAIYGIDLEGDCTFANQSCLNMLGFKHLDDVVGKNMHHLIHHSRSDGTPCPMSECRIYEAFQKGVGTHVDDEVLWRKDGTPFAAEYWSYPMRENGRMIGSVVTFLDITERIEAQQAQQALTDALQDKASEMERFVYTVSHDLKSPLITIQGFLGLLDKDAENQDAARLKGDIRQIHKAADSMEVLLADLLEISRIGRLVNLPEEVGLDALAQDAAALVGGQMRQIGVQLDIAPDLPTLYGDRKRLLEVVQNLLDNAIKFMGNQRQPHITIGMRRENSEDICYVQDNGIGIAPQYHEKVFGLFERLNPGMEGTGIGLAIVKRIINLEGGRIWVESEGEGRGAAFCFVLPTVE